MAILGTSVGEAWGCDVGCGRDGGDPFFLCTIRTWSEHETGNGNALQVGIQVEVSVLRTLLNDWSCEYWVQLYNEGQ